MLGFLFKFKRAEIAKESSTKKSRASKERNAVPTLSVFTGAASRGGPLHGRELPHGGALFRPLQLRQDVPLSALDAETLRRYERWLREGGVCPNTSSVLPSPLRAIYNKAAVKRLVKDRALFKGLFTGNERTVKRSIGAEEVRRLVLSSFPSLWGRKKRKWLRPRPFLFSFYAMGIPVDLAHLKKSQVATGCLPTGAARRTGL